MAEAEAWVVIPRLDKDKTGCILDMRPLVLCKDCKHGAPTIINGVWLSVTCGGVDHKPEWFCADGEMRDGNG